MAYVAGEWLLSPLYVRGMNLLRLSDDCCDAAAVFINEFTYENNVFFVSIGFYLIQKSSLQKFELILPVKMVLSPLYIRYEPVALVG